MKNFMSRIECVVEPELYNNAKGETIRMTVRCKLGGGTWSFSKIEDFDFMQSNFDLVFDSMKAQIKDELLELLERGDEDDRSELYNEF